MTKKRLQQLLESGSDGRWQDRILVDRHPTHNQTRCRARAVNGLIKQPVSDPMGLEKLDRPAVSQHARFRLNGVPIALSSRVE